MWFTPLLSGGQVVATGIATESDEAVALAMASGSAGTLGRAASRRDDSGLPPDRRRKKREERIAREMLARQQHAEASAIARAGGVALHRPWRPEEQAEQDARQQAMRTQQMAEDAAQEAIEKARQAAEKARSQRIRLLVCAALVMDN